MAAITNTVVPAYELDHIYIVDSGDDNAERRMLLEGIVTQVTICSDGNVSFRFRLAGANTATDVSLSQLYYDTEAYRATGKKMEMFFSTVSDLLTLLGIPSSLYETFKANSNASQLLLPKGVFINSSLMVEEVDFPETWEFTRTVTVSVSESGARTLEVSDWKHDAKFFGKEIFSDREEALRDHKVKVLRLTGEEDEV